MKVFISLPMFGIPDDIVRNNRDKIKEKLSTWFKDAEFLDSYIEETPPANKIFNTGIYYLGRSLEIMAEADIVYFPDNWSKYRGCKFEHDIALSYGLTIIEDCKFEQQLFNYKPESTEALAYINADCNSIDSLVNRLSIDKINVDPIIKINNGLM